MSWRLPPEVCETRQLDRVAGVNRLIGVVTSVVCCTVPSPGCLFTPPTTTPSGVKYDGCTARPVEFACNPTALEASE